MCLINAIKNKKLSGYITVNVVHGAIGHSYLNEQFQFEVNKLINPKMASDQ